MTTKNTLTSSTSTITSELIVSDSISLDEPVLTDDAVYYLERRPHEGGRCVIVKASNNKTVDILPAPYSARSRVHEYGGGCYCIGKQIIFFINDADQNIYSIINNEIKQVTHTENQRFADFCYDSHRHRLISICETHKDNQVTNAIISIDADNGSIATLEQGHDFYASPRLNNSNTRLCWQCWDHPNMPWDGNRLWLADINQNGETTNQKNIAGDNDISVFQPQWSPDDVLHFISDDTGWWHLYRYIENDQAIVQQLTRGEKEFGLPQWVFAQSSYTFIDDERIVCSYQQKNNTTLALLETKNNAELKDLTTPWQMINSITGIITGPDKNRISFIAAANDEFPQLITASIGNNTELSFTVIKTSCHLPITKSYYSKAQNISFTNRHGLTVHANYYPSTLKTNNNKPAPLIVICHGGPTGQSSTALDPKKQFWTSHGFSLLDVNYSGSTGYGRDYRRRLEKKWGELDVEDCCDAALFAVSKGLADKDKLIIRGSSAGGFTVLAALTFENVFSAGASYYGISELNSLAADTHKFESRYLDQLVGPYPDCKPVYDKRSPINSTEHLNCPVIFFQGIEDKVVPKEQAETMFNALDKKGLPVAVQYYPGEQHGFRKAETIIQSLENELGFYQMVFNLKPREEIKFLGDIQIKNI